MDSRRANTQVISELERRFVPSADRDLFLAIRNLRIRCANRSHGMLNKLEGLVHKRSVARPLASLCCQRRGVGWRHLLRSPVLVKTHSSHSLSRKGGDSEKKKTFFRVFACLSVCALAFHSRGALHTAWGQRRREGTERIPASATSVRALDGSSISPEFLGSIGSLITSLPPRDSGATRDRCGLR